MSDAQFRDLGRRATAADAGVTDPGSARPAETAADRLGGLGSVLIAVYIVLAIAATCRSVYQIITKFDEAPVSYALSALAGVVYIVAAVALIKRWRPVAWAALGFEMLGVLVIGTLSLTHADMFGHDDTVWSTYGGGYLWIPLVLPALGMWWLRSDGRESDEPVFEPDPDESLY